MNILETIIRKIASLIEGSMTEAQVEAALERKATEASQKLDWRRSIVDLLKLIGEDSSLEHRRKLAQELGHTGPFSGTAAQNIWLHARVLEKLR